LLYPQKMKYLGINIIKEKHKPLKKEIKEDRILQSSPMLMDWQNQCCKNGYITKSNLHVQCNPHQNSNDIHHRV
jgi:hypothetical protein